MPQHIDVQGVGVIEFPDETPQDEIQKVLDEKFGQKKDISAARAAGGHFLKELAPGAAFMAGAIPGAEAGAMVGTAVAPFLGPLAPLAPIAGGAIGGMVTGIPSAMAADWGQKKIAQAVAPEFAKAAEEELALGEKQQPWASALGGIPAMGASARMAPFKLAQLPFRVGLGAGMAVGVPAVTEGRLPTAPELVSGTLMGTLFGEHRFSKAGVARPAATPEVRAEREQSLLKKASDAGHDWTITDDPLAKSTDVVNIEPGKTEARVNRQNLHEYLEQDLPKDVSPEQALQDLINHETVHTATAREQAGEFWKNLSPYEQYLEKRRYHGQNTPAQPLTAEQYGGEAIRFWTQLAQEQTPTEFISSVKSENRTAKFLTQVQKMVQWTRKNLGRNASKEALKRNQEILDDVESKVEAAKEAIKKGAPDASSQQEAAAVHGDVRPPEEPTQELSPEKGSPRVQPQAEERVAERAQVPLEKEAPPAAPTEGAQPEQAPTGSVATPVDAPTEGPAATSSISGPLPEVKLRELEALSAKIGSKGYELNEQEYKRYAELSRELEEAERASGEGDQPSEPLAMSRKGQGTPEEKEAVMGFADKMEAGDTKRGNALSIEAGKSITSIEELDRLANLAEKYTKESRALSKEGKWDEGTYMGQRASLIREAIEFATNSGSWLEPKPGERDYGDKMHTYGSRNLDWRENQDVAEWIDKNKDKFWPADRTGKENQHQTSFKEERAGVPSAMSRKVPDRTPEEQVAARVIATIGGVGKDPERLKIVQDVVGQVLAMPKEHWDAALTQFHQDWKAQDIADEHQEIAKERPDLEKIAGGDPVLLESLKLGDAIEKMFGSVDRQGAYRSALGELNKAVTPRQAPASSGKAKVLPAGGSPENLAVRPEYDGPEYSQWWTDFHQDHPQIPENVAREVWAEAAYDVLNNASSDRLKELLKAARLEKRFLGNNPAPKPGESDSRRVIPDANPYPILDEIAKAPAPTDSVKFRRFLAARDLTPEQGMAALKELEAKFQHELQQGKELLEGAAQQAPVPTGKKGIAFQTAKRTPMGDGERRDLWKEWRTGRAINQKRRQLAIDALSEWLIGKSKPAEGDPMRKTIGVGDIWFWMKRGTGAYAEYSPFQGENQGFLKSAIIGIGGSVKGQTASKKSRSVVIAVDRNTGDHHAVSAYVRQGQPMIYNPDHPVGSKEGNFITLPELLSKYRVAATLVVKDPLYRLHQAWMTEKGGKTGEQKFNEEIGDFARTTENATQDQYQQYLLEKEAGRQEEIEAQHEQRFGEIKPEDKPENEMGEEEEEEKSPLSALAEKMTKDRSERETSAWKESENPPTPVGHIPLESQIAIDAWMKGGVGRGPLGLFETDLRSLAGHSLTGNEAESVYHLFDELGIKSGYDFEKLLQKVETAMGIAREEEQRAGLADVIKQKRAPLTMSTRLSGHDIAGLYGINKIVNKVHNEMLRSPFERKRIDPLRKAALEGKPKDSEPLPDAEYDEMNQAEKAYYDALQALKYRAILRSIDKIYEIANEARTDAAKSQEAPAGEFATPTDVRSFRTKALDRYGDKARSSVEQAAVQEQRGTEITGPKPGRRIPSGPEAVTAGKRFPPAPPPTEMLPEGSAPYQEAPPPKGAFPLPGVPVTPSDIGGSKFTGQPPAKIPERGTPVPFGKAEKGFVPSAPSRHELLTGKPLGVDMPGQDPLAMTRKGYGPSQDMADEARKARGLPGIQRDDQPPVSKQEYIARGRDLIGSGKINPEKEMARYEAAQAKQKGSGYLSENSALAFRYWGYHLQEMADAIAEKYPKTKRAEFAQELSDSWQKRLEGASGEMFARLGHGLQGWNQIGPDDMKSTTFVRRYLKKARAKEKGIDEDDYDLTDEDEEVVKNITRRVKQFETGLNDWEALIGEEATKGTDPDLDEGNKAKVSQFEKYTKGKRKASLDALKKDKPTGAAMAMKGEPGELPPLDPHTEDLLGNVGMDVMAELSKKNDLTDARWLEEMKKELGLAGRDDLEPYLPHIRAVSEEIRTTAINNVIGTGDATKDARKIFTRKRPPIEESIAAIHRAIEADPSGKTMTPAESYHVWNYLKTRFLDKDSPTHTLDFKEIRTKAAAELGIKDDTGKIVDGKEYSQLRLFRAMSSNRTMKTMTEELIKRMRDEARIKGQAVNWLKNQQFPGWLRTMRMFPRLFFMDKIMGHGLVPMITHAPTMLFNPMAWSVYFGKPGKTGAWAQMYRMTGLPTEKGQFKAKNYHESVLATMTEHENFEKWKKAGLQCDPFKYTDDYQIEALQKAFKGKMDFLFGGRGFDALKTLRYAMAEKWYNSLPEHLQNQKSMELISDSVNHSTGIVKSNFHESLNWLMFAPKLEASRWAYIFKDTVKASDIIRKWNSSSLEQRAWATREMKQKAMVVGMYAGMLALNQAFLQMTGSDQKINYTDPTKPDFMAFKVAGFKVGVASPLTGMIRLFANALHAAVGERTKYEKLQSRQKQLMTVAGKYARGKASPFASFGIDLASQEDYAGRKLPWASEQPSRSQRLRGESQYGTGEYLAQTFTPIPIEEMVKETWGQMGMSPEEINKLMRALVVGVTMSATGARVSEDVQ